MGYLQMDLTNFETGERVSAIGLGYEKFLTDLSLTADSDYEKWDEYPTERFHERMEKLLDDVWNNRQVFPLIFSVELDEDMSFLGCSYRFTFIVVNKTLFKKTQHEYELDDEFLNNCLGENTGCVVFYTGMSLNN